MLRLSPIDPPLLAAFRESPAALEAHLGAALGGAAVSVAPMLEMTAALYEAKPREPRWGCFVAIDDSLGFVVGCCGYKDGPAANGSVEIAYGTFAPFEGKGYATAMAAELVARAGVHPVIAHTLAERNASCRVLEKCGFTFAGKILDPEDGPVWRWQR